MKLDPFTNPWRTHIGRQHEDLAVERVKAVRQAVGPDTEILIEVHRRLSPNEAIRIANPVEEFAPFWYEEPVDAEDMEGLAEVRRRINLPVVTGEALYSKAQFAQVFAQRAADILNPDVCNCGGILAPQRDRLGGGAVARRHRPAQLQQHDARVWPAHSRSPRAFRISSLRSTSSTSNNWAPKSPPVQLSTWRTAISASPRCPDSA